jgi:hypothetical protein
LKPPTAVRNDEAHYLYDLMQEISGAGLPKVDPAQPTTAPPAQSGACARDDTTHTVSLIESSTKKDGGTPNSFRQDDEVMDFDK